MFKESPIIRRVSRQIMVGNVPVGGDAPITVQSMTNTLTTDVAATVAQIKALEAVGADIVRVSVPTMDAAEAFREIKKQTKLVVKRLDHQYLNEIKPFDVLNPTAENIAKYFFDEIALLITNKDVKVKEVMIWETPRSAVTYSE